MRCQCTDEGLLASALFSISNDSIIKSQLYRVWLLEKKIRRKVISRRSQLVWLLRKKSLRIRVVKFWSLKPLITVRTNPNVTVCSASAFLVLSRIMNVIAVNTSVSVIKVSSATVVVWKLLKRKYAVNVWDISSWLCRWLTSGISVRFLIKSVICSDCRQRNWIRLYTTNVMLLFSRVWKLKMA